MKLFYPIFILANLVIASCTQVTPHSCGNSTPQSHELLDFAKANCFFWYFKKMNYDLGDIGAITGGVVERGSYSPEKYREVAFLVKKYKPRLTTKNNIDIDLLKCFNLESDEVFLDSLNKLTD